ncbi:MAG TPA: AI-2E family transporter [Alphaproteobacteria bacterium]|nr:AI-2E family transporter [Alphaproteobacteria bacterium]USO04889.1 MAG: AI-2E family transporter [Rhodospirillales bacterium]HOO82777.1 AI-2E family transporter [Alphaproteobacteria bacterium]
MNPRNHALFWSLAFAAFLGLVFIFKAVLLPFVLGLAIAYFLNPLVGALGRIKLGRGLAAMVILILFFIVVGTFLALLAPVLYKQSLQLIEDLPSYIDMVLVYLEPHMQRVSEVLGQENGADLKALLSKHSGSVAQVTKQLLQGMLAGGQAVLDMISVLVFTPIIAYFMMKEWMHITAWVEDLLPQQQKNTILDLLKQIDVKISGFVRGQISVAVILGLSYAIALTTAGLKYGFLIGLASGLLSIIPMVGSAFGLVISVAVAWFQTGDLTFVAIIAAIFLIGQIIEGNILSPKIVGESVGMHPLWVFFALLAGGSLFGILGMLLAVPVAAVAGVLLAFAITQYKTSPYYGQSKEPEKQPAKKPKKSSKKSSKKKEA